MSGNGAGNGEKKPPQKPLTWKTVASKWTVKHAPPPVEPKVTLYVWAPQPEGGPFGDKRGVKVWVDHGDPAVDHEVATFVLSVVSAGCGAEVETYGPVRVYPDGTQRQSVQPEFFIAEESLDPCVEMLKMAGVKVTLDELNPWDKWVGHYPPEEGGHFYPRKAPWKSGTSPVIRGEEPEVERVGRGRRLSAREIAQLAQEAHGYKKPAPRSAYQPPAPQASDDDDRDVIDPDWHGSGGHYEPGEEPEDYEEDEPGQAQKRAAQQLITRKGWPYINVERREKKYVYWVDLDRRLRRPAMVVNANDEESAVEIAIAFAVEHGWSDYFPKGKKRPDPAFMDIIKVA